MASIIFILALLGPFVPKKVPSTPICIYHQDGGFTCGSSGTDRAGVNHDCNPNSKLITAEMKEYAAAEVELAVTRYRMAMKVMMGIARGVPWSEIKEDDVDAWLAQAEKAARRAKGGR